MRKSSRSSVLKWLHEQRSLSSMVVALGIRDVEVGEEVGAVEVVEGVADVVGVVEDEAMDEIVTLNASPSLLLQLKAQQRKVRLARSASGLWNLMVDRSWVYGAQMPLLLLALLQMQVRQRR